MPVKMLVVDDEPDLEALIRQKFRREIKENEFQFIFAQNGLEALKKIEDHPDTTMVLSDINMPGMDGLTLLSKLGELNNPALKAVIVSAYGDMENIRTAMNRGAFDFLTKPIDFDDLEVTIRKTLEHLLILKQALKEHEQLISVQRDLNIAARIQTSILPRIFPPFPDRKEVDIYAEMLTAKEVGGDFYDFYFLDNDRLAFVIGDVSGKGVPAALFMAVSRTVLKAVASQIIHPGEVLRRVNTMLIPESDAAMFVTVFYGVLNTRTGEIQFSNGGHNSPIIVRASGEIESLPPVGGLFLGKIDQMEYDVAKAMLKPGDAIFLYTDGVTEAMNLEQELFGDSRLTDALKGAHALTLEKWTKKTQHIIKEFANGAPQSDDITMLTLRFRGSGA
jgi:sigma-B regulation protein RsbU (phosphoserine phosphatase)